MSASKYKDLSYTYTTDLAETIRKDYNNLTSSGLQTLIIVFLCMLVFVSIKEALIGVLSIPLAFFYHIYGLGLPRSYTQFFDQF